MKRLSVTRMNFYMRYLQPKNRRATRRERKATKTLAIVLGEVTCSGLLSSFTGLLSTRDKFINP